MKRNREFSSGVDNAMRLLQCFLQHEELGISELSRELVLSKSSVSRLVVSLERHNMLMQNPNNQKYKLGFSLMLYGYLAQDRNTLSEALISTMHSIASKFHVTTHLGVLSHDKITILNKISEGPFVYMSSRIGGTLNLYATALGKCILAYSPTDEVLQILNNIQFEKITDHTITTVEELLSDLNKIRSRGYAIDDEETHSGLYCVALPIFDLNKKPIAALSVSGQKSAVSIRESEIVQFVEMKLLSL